MVEVGLWLLFWYGLLIPSLNDLFGLHIARITADEVVLSGAIVIAVTGVVFWILEVREEWNKYRHRTQPGRLRVDCRADGPRRGRFSTVTTIVEIYTDGACSGNPGPGGWGAVLRYGGPREGALRRRGRADHQQPDGAHGRHPGAGEPDPAGRRAAAHRQRLRAQRHHPWLPGWKRNGWQTKDRKPVKNADLWQRLDAATQRHTIEWLWVKGHNGDPGNERADGLANRGLTEARTG